MNHSDLVARAARWLKSKRYPIVLSDVRITAISELPDVIGFRTSGDSLLVECKASREDFRRDSLKFFRRVPEAGMGYFRWYFAPVGVLKPEDMPTRWGLALVDGERVSIAKKPTPFVERAIRVENTLLVSALRRATEGWGRQMFGERAPLAPNGDPHPRAAAAIRDLSEENRRLRHELAKRSK
jgi:hypothetical protein